MNIISTGLIGKISVIVLALAGVIIVASCFVPSTKEKTDQGAVQRVEEPGDTSGLVGANSLSVADFVGELAIGVISLAALLVLNISRRGWISVADRLINAIEHTDASRVKGVVKDKGLDYVGRRIESRLRRLGL